MANKNNGDNSSPESMEIDEEIKIKQEPKEDTMNDVKTNGENVEDDDPVIKEIPVFLSKTLAKNLMLFQVRFFFLQDFGIPEFSNVNLV